MKVNSIANMRFKGTKVNKNNNTLKRKNQMNSTIELMEKLFETKQELINKQIPKDTPKINVTTTYNGADIYLARAKEYQKISEELDTMSKELVETSMKAYTAGKKAIEADDIIVKVPARQAKNNDSLANRDNIKGFKRIAGYKNELNTLNQEFITKIKKEKLGDDTQNIPNSILFFGPNRNGKTTITSAVAEESGANICKLDIFRSRLPEQKQKVMTQIKEIAQQSEENFKKDRTRTIIFIDEIDRLINNSSVIKDEFSDFIKNCSEKYHCSVFCATNDPLKLGMDTNDNKIFEIIMSIDPPNDKNKKEIIKHYLEFFEADNIDIDSIVNFLKEKENETGKLYNNQQLATIFTDLGTQIQLHTIDENDITKYLEDKISSNSDLLPRITQDSILKFKEEHKTLVKINNNSLDEILFNCSTPENINKQNNELSNIEEENSGIISKIFNLDYNDLKDVKIKGKSIADFWLELENANEMVKQNPRLKEMWFNEIIQNDDKIDELIIKTLDVLQQENELIKAARTSYMDIIENENDITSDQKEILMQQCESELFFRVVSNNINPNEILNLEVNILTVLRQLSQEKNKILTNANENIFKKINNYLSLSKDNPDDVQNVDYIFKLISQKAQKGTNKEKETIRQTIEEFLYAKQISDEKLLETSWQSLLSIAQDYFETTILDEITDRNISLLNSINKNLEGTNNKTVLLLINNPSLTIEQREFISRYKNDKNFIAMLNNSNINIAPTIEELVFFEAANKDLISQSGIDFSDNEFTKMMSEKFHQINKNNKDINIQGEKISSKLDNINSSIVSQSEIISIFSDNFLTYADNSTALQNMQLQQLIEANTFLTSINQNTSEIKQHTQTLVKTKLVELEKDKRYKEIVPDLVKLLPDNEEIDIREFLSKVDTIAKKEKNTERRNKIIKAAAIIAGVIAACAAIYYFGPTVVAHLASGLPASMATDALSSVSVNTSIAKKLGNSGIISFGQTYQEIVNRIKSVENQIQVKKNELARNPNNKFAAKELDRLLKELAELKKALADALKKEQNK